VLAGSAMKRGKLHVAHHCDVDPRCDLRSPHFSQIKDLGCKAGVVLNPATPLSAIENVLSFVGALASCTSLSHRVYCGGAASRDC